MDERDDSFQTFQRSLWEHTDQEISVWLGFITSHLKSHSCRHKHQICNVRTDLRATTQFLKLKL